MTQQKMTPEEEGGAVVSPTELPGDGPKAASTSPSEAGESMASTNTNSVIFTPDGSACGTPEETTPRATFNLPYRPAPTASVDAVITSFSSLGLGPEQQAEPEPAQAPEHEPEPEQPKPMSKSAKQRLKKKMKKQQQQEQQEQPRLQITSSSKGQRARLKKQLKKNLELQMELLSELGQDDSPSKKAKLERNLEKLQQRLRDIELLLEAHQQFVAQQSQQNQPSSQAQSQQGLSKSQKRNLQKKTARKQATQHEEEPSGWGGGWADMEVPEETDVGEGWADTGTPEEPSDGREEWVGYMQVPEEPAEEPEENQPPRRKEVLTAAKIAELFHDYFGDRKLANWQRFCVDLGLGDENISTLTQCKKALESVHINIYELMDAIEERNSLPEEKRNTPLKVRKYNSANQLFKHAKKGGLFPRRAAKEGGPLLGLLKHFYGPGGHRRGLPSGGGVLV